MNASFLHIIKIVLFAIILAMLPICMSYAENYDSIDDYDEYDYEQEYLKEPLMHKEMIPFSKKQLADLSYAKAIDALKHGEDVKAAELLLRVLENYPAHTESRLKLIEVYRSIGWNNEAQNILTEGLRLEPDNYKLIVHQATMMLEEKSPEKALSTLLKVKKESQYESDYKAALAMTYFDLKLLELAKKNYNYLVRKDSHNSKWWLGLAVTMDAQGDIEGAIKSFKRVQDLGGTNAEVLRYTQARLAKLTAK